MTPLNILGNTKLQDAISKIKQALTTYPIMRHPEFNKKFLLATGGSLFGFGSVFFQETDDGSKYVVVYASSILAPAHKRLYGPQLEAAATCWAMTYFGHHLLGRQFVLLTDQVVLKYLKTNDEPVCTLAAYALESHEFDYTVQHIPGKKHASPDFLS